jgi:hypothetical protein
VRENDSKKRTKKRQFKNSAFHPQSGLFGGEKVEQKISILATNAKDTLTQMERR